MNNLDGIGAKTAPILSVFNLTVGLPLYGDRQFAVEDVNLELAPGKTVCLVGESGSGKSIIGHSIMGMLPSQLKYVNGQIFLKGNLLPEQRDPSYSALRSVEMSMIFQDASLSLNPLRKIRKQLEEIIRTKYSRAAELENFLKIALHNVELTDHKKILNSYPHQISGGQAQRVVIAAALLQEPSLLIADEPTTALDVTTQASILKLIDKLKIKLNLAVLFITHDFGVVAEIADEVCVLRDGRIIEKGETQAILQSPKKNYTKHLIYLAQKLEKKENGYLGKEVLALENLNVVYKSGRFLNVRKTKAVVDVSFSVNSGQTLGIVGESGSGKSSLAKAILLLEQIDSGSIKFKGTDILNLNTLELKHLRRKMQIVLQDPFSALNPRKTILSAISEGPIIHGVSKTKAEEIASRLLRLTGLAKSSSSRYPHEFSGGQRQRICIARALALEPEILIADEAVSALDVSIQAQILDLFKKMQQRFGFALIFITHDLRVARAICDTILVMKDGQVVEKGYANEIFKSPKNPYTKLLLNSAPKSNFGLLDLPN